MCGIGTKKYKFHNCHDNVYLLKKIEEQNIFNEEINNDEDTLFINLLFKEYQLY